MEDCWKIAGISGTAGLVLAVSLAYGVDISKEGITLIVIGGIFEGLKGLKWKILSFIVNLGFFIFGLIFSYKKLVELSEEGWRVISVSCLSFISILLIYLGMALNISIQNLGAYLIIVDLLLLIYLYKFDTA